MTVAAVVAMMAAMAPAAPAQNCVAWMSHTGPAPCAVAPVVGAQAPPLHPVAARPKKANIENEDHTDDTQGRNGMQHTHAAPESGRTPLQQPHSRSGEMLGRRAHQGNNGGGTGATPTAAPAAQLAPMEVEGETGPSGAVPPDTDEARGEASHLLHAVE